jgi:hypothetical protein
MIEEKTQQEKTKNTFYTKNFKRWISLANQEMISEVYFLLTVQQQCPITFTK